MRISVSPAARALRRAIVSLTLLDGVFVLGLTVGGIGLSLVDETCCYPSLDTARSDMGNLAQSVEMYQLQKHGECPETVQDLEAAGVIKKANEDPWGSDYALTCPGAHDTVDIVSAGPDREFGTEDDLHSWDVEN